MLARMAPLRKRPDSPRSGKVTPAPQGELAWVRLIRDRAEKQALRRGHELRLGIGDDCAILRPRAGEEIVVTTDFSLEGRHFRRDWHSAASAGHRTLARGLSDIAAMGARPLAAFLSLALPRSLPADPTWGSGFLDGLLSLAASTGTPLAGGDTAEAPGEFVLADITLLGAVPAGQALRRDGARAGDRIFCTGALGGAAAELQQLAKGKGRTGTTDNIDAHPQLYPQPRLAVGQMLRRRRLATAAIDLSDGLSTDLRHLCEASGLAAEIYATKLPLHTLAVANGQEAALDLALNGGEDYELLFTAPPGANVPRTFDGIRITEIGRMLRHGPGQPLVQGIDADGDREELLPGGWEHLR